MKVLPPNFGFILLMWMVLMLTADDLEFPGDVAPVATLLPALDPTPMGWQERDWFLGQHRSALFGFSEV